MSSRGHGHKSVPESTASWPYALIFLFIFLQPPNLSSHILCSYTHTRLQNTIIYIPVKNKIKKTNSRKTWYDLRGLRVARWLP